MEQQMPTSDSSEEHGSSQTQTDLLDLEFRSLQQQSQVLTGLLPAPVSVPFKESKKTSRRRNTRESHKKSRTQKALIQLQPISTSLCFGGRSTLRGTPWEDALSGSTESTDSTLSIEKHSEKAGKRDQGTFKETKIVTFWKQFFG